MKRLSKNELVILDELDQDSPEWLLWRNKGIGSSDVAVLMSPQPVFDRTIGTLWRQKIGYERAVQVNNPHVKRGKLLEPKIREKVNKILGTNFIPTCMLRRDAPYLRASLDGFDSGADILLEIKAPAEKAFQKMLELAKDNKIPENYYQQMQYQMLVSDVEYGIFAFYNEQIDEEGNQIHPKPYLIVVENNYEKQLEIEKRSHLFWRAVETKTPIGWVDGELRLFHQRPVLFVAICTLEQSVEALTKDFVLPKVDVTEESGIVFLLEKHLHEFVGKIRDIYPNHDVKIINLTDNPFGKAGEVTLENFNDYILKTLTEK